jgi:presqualene diphosphate synthase
MTGTDGAMPMAAAPAPGGVGDPDAAIEGAVARSGTSFYWAMRLLPAPRRAAMFAIYAFCRAVDDIVDEPGTPAAKAAGLAEWRAEIDRIYAGRATTDIGRGLALAVGRFGMARGDFLAVIDGMAMDMGEPLRRPTLAELELYCDRVAVAVGLLSVCAFGTPPAPGRRLAHALGRAFQLTNILRDLVEDAGLGRLYLPDEWLSEAGIASSDPAEVLRHPALGVVCGRLAGRARGYFAEAARAMAECPRASVRPARVMGEVYRRVLDRLEARGWSDPGRPVGLGKATKLLIALRYGLI